MIFSIEKKPEDRIAFCEETGEQITYGKLCIVINEMNDKIEKRSLVLCLCENSIASVLAYLNCMNDDKVAMLLDADMESSFIENICKKYEPAYIWISAAKRKEMMWMLGKEIYSYSGYVLLKTDNMPYSINEKLSLLLSTSGSTGGQKFVRLSKKNIESNAVSIMEYLELDENERPITVLPMHYTYGLSVINSHLLAGATIIMTKESIIQKKFWQMVKDLKATSLSGVPYTYKIMKRLKILNQEIPEITSFTQAGGKLPAFLQREFGEWAEKYSKKFYIMYGQTEATARMSYLPPDKCLEKNGSIGIPVPGGSFQLKADDGSIITMPYKTGELIYKGDNVSLGYAVCRDDLKKGDERKSVLETGDLAEVDEDGFYYIVGRKSRFIKVTGVRIGLDECEQELNNNFTENEFACTGHDDMLLVYTTSEEIINDVEEWITKYLKIHSKLFEVRYINEIPKNTSGKIQYIKLVAD